MNIRGRLSQNKNCVIVYCLTYYSSMDEDSFRDISIKLYLEQFSTTNSCGTGETMILKCD